MIDAVTVELPVAGITELDVQFGGGAKRIISTTAPTDTTAIWVDPESGIQAIYSGGGWVTQLIVTIDGDVVKFDGQVVIFAGQQLTF